MVELIQSSPWIMPIASIVAVAIVSCIMLLIFALYSMKNKQADEKSVHDVALEVLAGLWGNDQDRRDRLTAAGYDYAEVQEEVNNILKKE